MLVDKSLRFFCFILITLGTIFFSSTLFAFTLKEVALLIVREKQSYPEASEELLKIRKYKEDGRLMEKAEGGDPLAQYKAGLLAFLDYKYLEARDWFEKSAEQGFKKAGAAFNYFEKYYESFLHPQRTASRSPNVQYEVALMSRVNDFRVFSNGEVSTDTVKWLERAAKKGHPEALFDLGMLHHQMGNLQEAVKLLSKAARKGHTKAQDYLFQLRRSSANSRRTREVSDTKAAPPRETALAASGESCNETWSTPPLSITSD